MACLLTFWFRSISRHRLLARGWLRLVVGDTRRLQHACLLVVDDSDHLIFTEGDFLLEKGLKFVIVRRQLLQVHKAFACDLILFED